MLAAPLAGQQSGFPTRPLGAAAVALGDGGGSPTAPDAVFLNPARAVGARGLFGSYLLHESTGLRGNAIGVGVQAGLPLVLTVWKYEVADLFDDALIAIDPSLAAFGAYVTGMDLTVGFRAAGLAIGAGTSAEFQRTVGRRSERVAGRVGVHRATPTTTLGLSWTNAMSSTPFTGGSQGAARANFGWNPVARPVGVTVGVDLYWSRADGQTDASTYALVGPASLKWLAGWRWTDQQLTSGIMLRVGTLTLAIAREFGGRDVLGGLTVLTLVAGRPGG